MAYNPLTISLFLVSIGSLTCTYFLFALFRSSAKKSTFENMLQNRAAISVLLPVAIISFIYSMVLFISEPIPSHYVELYGVALVLFSLLLFTLVTQLFMGVFWSGARVLLTISGLVFFNISRIMWVNSLSKSPLLSALLFFSAGCACILSSVISHVFSRRNKTVVLLALVFFSVAGLLALFIGLGAQTSHVLSALS